MISEALERIAPSRTTAMTDRAAELRAEGKDIISLSVGEPDFATPPHIIEAAKAALDAGETKYTPVGGTVRMKQAAAIHFARDLGIEVPISQITVSAGGKQAIFHALMATVSHGDDVLVPSPWWVSYPEMVRFAGGRVIPIRTGPGTGFRFGAGQVESAITPQTQWLLLNSPGNPTGAVYPEGMLRSLAEILRAHPRIMVLSDDIYAPLNYTDAGHVTLAAVAPDLASRILTVSGVSKTYAMTGFRIGVAAGPEWLIRAMERLQSHSSGNPCSVSQAAAAAAFEGQQDLLGEWRSTFRVRRDLVVEAVNAIPGLSCPTPDGAFYCFVDAGPVIDRFGPAADPKRDEALAMHLLEHGVAVVAASAFGGQDGFRISFAAGEETLREALRRIAAALS